MVQPADTGVVAGALRRAWPWLAVAAAALVAACGGGAADDQSGERAAPWVDPSGDEPVVGSLAVDPRDRGLWLATNRGLYRVGREGGRPRQVTGTLRTTDGSGRISAQLVIGFDERGAMVASGHPDSQSALPPVLGLIRSSDRGRTWESVSELGAADFHVLERSRGSLVGAQYGEAQILVSDDGGRRWRTRVAPGTILDLAVDPGRGERWAATTEDGVFASRDAGRTWRPVDALPHVRLAWAADGTLYRIDPDGRARRSGDGGMTWKAVGTGPVEPQALAVDDASALFAATADGRISRSADGGRSWQPLRLG